MTRNAAKVGNAKSAPQLSTPHQANAFSAQTPSANSDTRMTTGSKSGLTACDRQWPYMDAEKDLKQGPSDAPPQGHWSSCAVYNEPAFPRGPCDCGIGLGRA